MATPDKTALITLEKRFASALSKADATAKYLLDEGLITETEFKQMLSEARGTHQAVLRIIWQAKGTT